jgi:hypothetical protein
VALILLATTFTAIFLALYANFNELIVSSRLYILGATLTMICVNVFPPKLSYNNLVNLDSLYGTGSLLFFLLFSDRFYMTLPRVVSDWLMLFNSMRCALFICSDLLIFSEPAKSHRFTFDLLSTPFNALLDSIIN